MANKKKSETPTLNLDWVKSPKSADNPSKSGIIEDKPKKVRHIRLTKPGSVRRLLSRVVNQLMAGEIPPPVANSVTMACNALLRSFEMIELEQKLNDLEQQISRKKETKLRVVK